ncbi:hypothetical protein M8J75_013531 [Diaphorina citri]|nr:hypothetical protein M8J75_013531 [Diaphorina citri]
MCYENLDMKHIQLDSLGYLHLGPLLSMAQFTLAAKNADHLVLSYKFGSFLKIDEFHRFRQRLNNSIHYTLSTIEKMLLDILHVTSYNEVLSTVETMDVEPQVDNILWDELEDNRDLSVFNTCNPSHMKPDTHIQSLTYAHDLTHLRIRALLLRILVASIHIAHAPSPPAQQNGAPNEGEGNRVGVLRQLTEELASLYEGLVKEPPVQVPAEVQGAPPPSRLFFYLSHSFLPHFLAISRAVVELASQPEGPGFEAHMVQAVVYLKKDFEAVQEQFAAVSERGSWQNHRALIQTMSLFVEMIAITNIKCGAMAAILKANKSPNSRSKEQNAKKKKKHKKTQSGGGASEPSAENHVSGEVKDPVPILNNVLEITKELSRQVTGLTKSCEDLLDSHFQGNHSLNISQDTSEGRLVHALLAYEEPSQRTLVAKVENLRLDDGKNKKHTGRNSLPGDLLESEDPTRSPGRELDPAAEKDEEAKREALDGKKASVPAIESHCGGSCVHRRKLTWAECAVKVNENVMNSYKVSYNKIRLINLFKSFAQE